MPQVFAFLAALRLWPQTRLALVDEYRDWNQEFAELRLRIDAEKSLSTKEELKRDLRNLVNEFAETATRIGYSVFLAHLE